MKRYLQLDFLRGLCLLVMTVDHFGELSLVELFGFISAAEAFVFISGTISGIVYYRRLQKSDFLTIKKSAFHRSFEIYKYHLICLLALVIVLLSNLPLYDSFYSDKAGLFNENLFKAAFLNALFLYKIYHLDILPMYVVFLLLVPLGLKYADASFAKYLLLGSFILWIANLFGATTAIYSGFNHFFTASPGNFQLMGWQFLFFLGFTFGILEVKGKLEVFKNSRYLFFISFSMLLLMFVLNALHFDEKLPRTISDLLFGKSDIGVMRLINFLALSGAIGYVFNRYHQLGKNGFLRLLGRHSLYVFTFQTVFLFVFIPFYQQLFIHDYLSNHFDSKIIRKGLSLAVSFPLALVIFLPAYLREKKIRLAKAVA